MRIAATIAEARTVAQGLRRAKQTLGFVPTMGALHIGHASLVRAAKTRCDAVVVSIFVNPTQFGPTEDLDRYPRPFTDDKRLLEMEGVDLLFTPSAEEIFPADADAFVTVDALSSRLDGLSRPGHFRGVATVVAKLFNILQPDLAFFGQKDAAQVAVLQRMVRDLNFPVEMIVCPTVREPDGLAMSSRNRYLSPQDRNAAPALFCALHEMEKTVIAGEHRADVVLAEGLRVLESGPGVRVDYLVAVHPDTLEPLENLAAGGLLAVAAWVGDTRLIDNVLLKN